MDALQLIKRNRLPRKQRGERIETKTAWCLRYYVGGKQKFITLAHKDGMYRSWMDVEPLIENVLREFNEGRDVVTPQQTLAGFVEGHYLLWCDANKAAPTANSYRRIWHNYWKAHIGKTALANLATADVTAGLTALAKDGKGSRTLEESDAEEVELICAALTPLWTNTLIAPSHRPSRVKPPKPTFSSPAFRRGQVYLDDALRRPFVAGNGKD